MKLGFISVLILLLLHSAHADKGVITRLTNDGRSATYSDLGWSPDSKHILFWKKYDEGSQLWIMDADGANPKAISKIGAQKTYKWSPDSTKVLYVFAEKDQSASEGCAFIYDLSTGQNREIASGFRWHQFQGAEWNVDCKSLVLIMRRSSDENDDSKGAFLIDIATGKRTDLAPNNHRTGSGSWSPDGEYFAMSTRSSQGSHQRVWMCKRDGSQLHPITSDDSDIQDPHWSPKGDWIAFTSTKDRPEEEKNLYNMHDVWLVHPDGTGLHAITHGSSPSTSKRVGYYWPEWTADGRYIACEKSKFDEMGQGFQDMCLIDINTKEVITVLANDADSDQQFSGHAWCEPNPPTRSHWAFIDREFTFRGRTTINPILQNERHIVFSYDIPGRTLSEIDTSRPRQDGKALFRQADSQDWQPVWSPDDSKLLFVRAKVISYPEQKFETDLYVYQVDGSASRPQAAVRHIVTSDGVNLYAEVRGKGTPCLYIHGGPGSGSYWLEKFSGDMLEQHFQMIYLDQRGVCRSTSPKDGNYSMDRMVKDFEEVRAALGIPKWITLGHSFGGILQVGYAQRHPQVIKGMIMLNCSLDINESISSCIPKFYEILGIKDTKPYEAMPVFERYGKLANQLREKDLDWKLGYASKKNKDIMDATFGEISNWNKDLENNALKAKEYFDDYRKFTADIKMPVLFFYGKTDWMAGPDSYKGVNFPKMMLWGSDVGHVASLENKDDLEKAIACYMQKYQP